MAKTHDAETRRWFARELNAFLDELGDFFGTEGQLDPRGDQRD